MKKYDLAIIGSGPGGYTAAVYASQKGLKVCLFEKKNIGGVCLNTGCIPTKTFYKGATLLEQIKKSQDYGIDVKEVTFDYKRLIAKKDDVVNKLSKGLEFLMKKRNVNIINQTAQFIDNTHIKAGDDEYEFDNVIISTGSKDIDLPFLKFSEKVLSSKSIWDIDVVPKKLVIVGGGVIGCEMATIFSSFGSEVTIVEAQDMLLPEIDTEASKKIWKNFKKKGVNVRLGVSVESTKENTVVLSDKSEIDFDKILLCVGRKSCFSNIKLENTEVEINEKGINVNLFLRTNVKNIYAIGDVTSRYMLAHTASDDAMVAVDNILGNNREVNNKAIPACIFTDPQIAVCGNTQIGNNVKVSKFLFSSLGRAWASSSIEGFVKLFTDIKSSKILGAVIMGDNAGELITEITLAIDNKFSAEDIITSIHVHPTFSEAILEAAHIAVGTSINSI